MWHDTRIFTLKVKSASFFAWKMKGIWEWKCKISHDILKHWFFSFLFVFTFSKLLFKFIHCIIENMRKHVLSTWYLSRAHVRSSQCCCQFIIKITNFFLFYIQKQNLIHKKCFVLIKVSRFINVTIENTIYFALFYIFFACFWADKTLCFNFYITTTKIFILSFCFFIFFCFISINSFVIKNKQYGNGTI